MTTYGVETFPDLSFKAGTDLELALDLYLPTPRPANCPTLVYFHGGAWARGSRTDYAQERILPVVRNGVAVASASYRLIDQAIWPAQLNDAAAAVKFVISITGRFGLDPRRVGVWGASAGGHLACMLVLASPVRELISGAVAWFPPTDLTTLETDPKPEHYVLPDFMRGQWARPTFHLDLVGGRDVATNQRLRQASPLHHINGAAKPIFLLHGDQDPLVPPDQSERFHRKLVEHGTDASFEVVIGATHEDPEFSKARILESVATFIKNLEPLLDTGLSEKVVRGE